MWVTLYHAIVQTFANASDFWDLLWDGSPSIIHRHDIHLPSILWPTGKRTTREHSKCRLYSALAAPENSWVGIRETPHEPMSSL